MPMKTMLNILLNSLKDVIRPKILSVIFLPFFGSFFIWGLVTWASWDWILSLGFKLYNLAIMQRFVEMLSPFFAMTADPLAAVTAAVFIVVFILPAALITALFITSLVLVPLFVAELRRTEFPELLKTSNSIFTGTGTSLSYSLKYFLSWVASLPFWIAFPFGALFIPFILLAWFNSRLFAWEVMSEISTPNQAKIFIRQNSKRLFLIGILTAFLYYIPILNIVAPVITSAVFARFCLSRVTYEKPI
jgi:CysZ protein